MKNHLFTLLFLLVALALYGAGMALPATALLILGMVAESVFWFRLMHRGRH